MSQTTGTASTPDAGNRPVGWGILATGRIAHSFARDLALVPGAEVAAAGSRRLEAAQAFCAEHGGTAHGSYAELVADPRVDVVYVASPHSLHAEHTRLAFDAGKPVLCEKPLTLDAPTSESLLTEARDRGLFLMEAMWMACHPLVRRMRELVLAGDHGTPRQLTADLGFVVDAPADSRMLDPALGASALLDMGIYPLTFAQLMLGEPAEQRAVAGLSDRGIDLDVAVAASYPSGAVATLTSSMTGWSPRSATLSTDRGRFEVAASFHAPTSVVFRHGGRDGETEVVTTDEPVVGRGYGNEALEVMRCLREGLLESPWVPHAQTLALIRQLDDLRAQVGVRFPD